MTTEPAIAESLQEAPTSPTSSPSPDAKPDAQDTPQAEASTEPDDVEKLKRKIANLEKRIPRITAARHEEARQKEEYAKQLAELRGPKKDDGAPKEADFATVEEYNKALGKWEATQEFTKQETERKQKEADTRRQESVSKLQKAHEAKEAEFRKSNPRYDENASVVNEAVSLANKNTPEFKAFADAMITSDDMAAVTNFLGENPDRLEAMFSMNPAQIYREIARIETQLATPPEIEEEPVKQVFAPPKPIGGTGKVAKPLDKMSAKQLVEWSRK